MTTISNLITHAHNLKLIPATDEFFNKPVPTSYTGNRYTSFDIESGDILKKFIAPLRVNEEVIIIHDTDMHGTVAGLILTRYLRNNCELAVTIHDAPIGHGGSIHGKVIEELKKHDSCKNVVILDHAFNGDIYNEIIKNGKQLLWIDHHPVQKPFENMEVDTVQFMHVIDPTYSTAELVSRSCESHHYLVDDTKPLSNIEKMVAYYTHFHDTWQYTKGSGIDHESYCQRVRGLVSWFYNEPRKAEILNEIMEMDFSKSLSAIYALIDAGESFSKFQSVISKNVSVNNVGFLKWKLDDVEYRIGYIFHSNDRSNVAKDILLEHHDKVDVALVIYRNTEEDLIYFSMRGTDFSPPINELAAHLGGGGHRNAAGFTVKPTEMGQYLQDRIFEKKKEST